MGNPRTGFERLVTEIGDSREWRYTGRRKDLGTPCGQCICGHKRLRYLFKLRNRKTDKKIIVGSTCVDRFDVINPALVQAVREAKKDLIQQAKRRAKRSSTLRPQRRGRWESKQWLCPRDPNAPWRYAARSAYRHNWVVIKKRPGLKLFLLYPSGELWDEYATENQRRVLRDLRDAFRSLPGMSKAQAELACEMYDTLLWLKKVGPPPGSLKRKAERQGGTIQHIKGRVVSERRSSYSGAWSVIETNDGRRLRGHWLAPVGRLVSVSAFVFYDPENPRLGRFERASDWELYRQRQRSDLKGGIGDEKAPRRRFTPPALIYADYHLFGAKLLHRY